MDKSTRLSEGIKQIEIVIDESEQDDIHRSLQNTVENLEMALESLEQQDTE